MRAVAVDALVVFDLVGTLIADDVIVSAFVTRAALASLSCSEPGETGANKPHRLL